MRNTLILVCLSALVSACADTPDRSSAGEKDSHAAHASAKPELAPPPLGAEKPVNYPGLHNVVTYHDGLYSGSVPEGEEGFESLAKMGVHTIISVDGAEPELELAKAHGLRYVHLPITYSGMDEERTLDIARAVRDLPGPIYVHCHHGKHRSAGAVGAAAVTLGYLTNDEATARMKVSGTAANYKGLYACVAVAKPADASTLSKADNRFPEISRTTGIVQTMVAIDAEFESLKAIEKAGWTVPKNHPDIVPVAVAGRLENLFRQLEGNSMLASKPADFHEWMGVNRQNAQAIEDELNKPAPSITALAAEFKLMNETCKQCHAKYRD